jgi:ATP-dependent RNA helicase RhlE
LQVAEHGQQLARGLPVRFGTVYGGVKMGPQIRKFQQGVDVVIATPGRLLDVMGRGHVKFHHLETLVLDEADRMMDIGFLPDIRKIVAELPTRRQTMLFSATIAPVYHLAKEVTWEPLRVEVEKSPTPEAIEHAFYPVREDRKMAVLEHLLAGKDLESVLVFVRTKNRANLVWHDLKKRGVKAEGIHGDRPQHERVRALEAFRKGRIRVLVATDVAARGIDITGISHVVNYDVPLKSEDYVHRIGRTGRADASGMAFSLVTMQDEAMAERIEKVIDLKIERRIPKGVETGRLMPAAAKEKPVRNGGWTRPARRRR